MKKHIRFTSLYNLGNKKKLVKLLNKKINNDKYHTSVSEIRNVEKNFNNNGGKLYISKTDKTIHNSKPSDFNKTKYRIVYNPTNKRKKILKALNKYLNEVKLPIYYHSKKNNSYFTNAKSHLGAPNLICLDLLNYFDTCKSSEIYKFFSSSKGLHMTQDISKILTKLCTLNGKLAQGLPTSTILAFLSYKQMFDDINKIVKYNDGVLSVYVDDITISFNRKTNISESKLDEIKNAVIDIIKSYGLNVNPNKTHCIFNSNETANITGLFLKRHRLKASQKVHNKLFKNFREYTSLKINDSETYLDLWEKYLTLNGLYITIKYTESPILKKDFFISVNAIINRDKDKYILTINPKKIEKAINKSSKEKIYRLYKQNKMGDLKKYLLYLSK